MSVSPNLAGPLNPPPGPVAPTGRFGPRIEVNDQNTPGDADSVYKISQPGSYYLAENLTGEAFKHGIEIDSALVTVDLNGFNVHGVSDTLDGIAVTASIGTSIIIRNGVIDNWAGDAIDTSSTLDCRIQDIEVNFGLGNGIRAGPNATVIDCSVQFTNFGFIGLDGCSFTRCRASSCRNDGFSVAHECSIESCSASDCLSNGIRADFFCLIADCIAAGNTQDGIRADLSTIVRCTARDNESDGIDCGGGSIVAQCLSWSNDGHGVIGSNGNLIEHCKIGANVSHGVRVAGFNIVRHNLCDQNGLGTPVSGGVYSTGGENWIEGNLTRANDYGVWVPTGSNNFIVRNVADDNSTTNFSIATGSAVGQIFAVGGGVTITTSNSWANFSF